LGPSLCIQGMRTRSSGFTLLEVLVALFVTTVGLLALLGTLGPVARLAGAGRLMGRAAQILASRADLLRAQVLAAAPACVAPGAGSQWHPDGISESWTATVVGAGVQVQIVARADTLVTRVACP